MSTYKVILFTGNVDNAGTDAEVFITITGTETTTREYILDNPGNDREQGSIDAYTVEAENIGNLSYVKIRHDNSGDRPGWFLDKVIIIHQGSGTEWTLPYYNWLAIDEGQIEAILAPS